MAFTVSPNSPSLGHIAWQDAHIVYDGVDYPIQDGSTNKRFVFWVKHNPNAFFTSDAYPSIGQEDAIVFLNKGGVPISVLTASTTDGDLVVPGTITASAIAANAISSDHIDTDAIVARHIVAGSIGAEKLSVNELSAISSNLGTATAGNFTLNSQGYIRGGAANFGSGTGFWMGYHNGFYKFRAGVPGSSRIEWTGEAFNVYGPDGSVTISSGVVDYAKLANQPQSLGDISSQEGTKLAGIAPGATRNVFRGDWNLNETYQSGDTVLSQGGGWGCVLDHTSSNSNKPPTSGNANTWWKLVVEKGADGIQGLHALTVVNPNNAHSLSASFSGAVSTYTGSGTEISVYEGATELQANQSLSANGQFAIGTPVVKPIAAITPGAISYSGNVATIASHSSMSDSIDSVTITYPVMVRRTDGTTVTIETVQTLSKSKAAAPAKTLSLTVSDQFIRCDANGVDSPSSVTLTANSQFATGPLMWEVISGGAAVVSTGVNTSVIDTSTMSTDQITVRASRDGVHDQVTIARVRDGAQGVDYDVQIESTHGTIFRPSATVTTNLIAHVFKNGVEITSEIPATAFRWRRVSIDNPAPPNDDATWNLNHASGFKQVSVTTDSLWRRATYHCDIQAY